VYLSDAGHEQLGSLADSDLAATALSLVRDAGADSGWTAVARHVHTFRWEHALPRFPAGYLRTPALQRPESLAFGTVGFAGDYLRAPHVEGALVSGRAAARDLMARVDRRRRASSRPATLR
jgi:predicted NAD/FAD-dependent oxidoreductase